jgi:hypothetical protein
VLENVDTSNILSWAVGLIFTAGVLVCAFLNRKIDIVDVKTDAIKTSLDAHVLLVEQTYAKAPAMKEGFEIAAKTAEKVAAALDAKLDKTQDAVQGIALEQAKQGENIKSMGDSIKNIALSIKDKSP